MCALGAVLFFNKAPSIKGVARHCLPSIIIDPLFFFEKYQRVIVGPAAAFLFPVETL